MNKKKLARFREILRAFDRELFLQNNASCCNGVTLTQCHTLLEIENKEVITITDLANNLSLDKSTVSRTVDGLVNIGLVDRTIPKKNRRTTELCLTDQGKKTCDSINYTNNQYILDVLADFTDQEKTELVRLFDKVTQNMTRLRETIDSKPCSS